MRLARFAALAGLLVAAPLAAQPAETQRPTLVVAISVDQLSSDLFNQYREHFSGGFARLLEGAVFPSGFQAHAATETCPGHSTILTGAHPARSGIIGNDWIDLDVGREDKEIYCAEDTSVADSSSEDYTVSPVHLLVPTLGDLLKQASPESRVVSLAGKDRSAVMLGGHNADHAYWPGDGGLQSYGGPGAEKPAAIDAANARIGAIVGRPREPRPLPGFCAPFARAVPLGNGQSIGDGRFASDSVTGRQLLTSPDADEILLEAGLAMVAEMELGRRGATDLLALGLAGTDYVGHTYGPGGGEMCIHLAALDEALGRFFDALDAQGIDYVAMLTADHGGLDMPERQVAQGAGDAERIDAAAIGGLDAEIAEAMGLPGPVFRSSGGMYYVDTSVPEDRRTEAIDRATALLRANRQVHAVYTRDQIVEQPLVDAPPENWTLLDRLRAAFHPERSGDFIVVLQPRVTPIPDPSVGYVATHGSPWDYDREVPILFWWPGAEPMEQPLGVMTVDIMPTLASLIGLDISGVEIDGSCLDVTAAIEESNCP